MFACVESTTKPIIEPSNEGVLKDNDNDGYLEDEDCDDDNPAINSVKLKFVMVLINCDGVIDEGVSRFLSIQIMMVLVQLKILSKAVMLLMAMLVMQMIAMMKMIKNTQRN